MPIAEGPGLGSRGQIGFAEESKWGVPQNTPTNFFDFNSESIVSDFEELISAAVRADRQVHKTRAGKESAGGDVPIEITPEGLGTLFKHALGLKTTKRLDVAAVVAYTGTDTNPVVTVALDSMTFSTTEETDDFSVTITDGMTQTEFIEAINTAGSGKNFKAFAPWGDGTDTATGGYFARSLANKGSAAASAGSEDYNVVVQTAAGVTNLEAVTDKKMIADGGSYYVFTVLNYKYGVYEHAIDGNPKLPEGLTVEVGRDIAAFNYYGSRVNTLSLNIEAGVLSTGTVTFMCKGVSTCGKLAADADNTGAAIPVVGLAYGGSEQEAKLGIDANDIFTFKEGDTGASATLFSFYMDDDYTDHSGNFWKVSTIAGFLEFLAYYSDKFFMRYKGGVPMDLASTNLATVAEATLSDTTVTTLSTDVLASYLPAIRGNYRGTDDGTSKKVTVTMASASTFQSSITGVAGDSTAQDVEYGAWLDIKDGNDQVTGFQIMFPETVTLTSGDVWSFDTFKLAEASTSYSDTEVLTGSVGSFLLKKNYTGEDFEREAVMTYNLSVTNNLYGDKYEIGDNQRAKLPEAGRRESSGTLTVEFDNLDNFRMFMNGIEGDFDVTAEADEYVNDSKYKYKLQIRTSKTKYTGAPINVPGNDMIVTDIPFRALADDSASMPDVRLVLVNSWDYI